MPQTVLPTPGSNETTPDETYVHLRMASLMVFLNTAPALLPHDSLQRRLKEAHMGTQCAQRPTGLKAYSQNDRKVIVAQRSRPYTHRNQTAPKQVRRVRRTP